MRDAISRFVNSGDTIYLAGYTHLIPFSAAHEILRQGFSDLTVCRATPDIIYDQMIAAGVVKKVIFSYAGNPGVGSLRAFRRAVEKNIPKPVEIEEYTHFGMISRVFAGAARLPFVPLRSNLGSDLPSKNPNIRFVRDPYTGEEISVVPPLNPKVTVVHAQRADAEGNAQIWGIIGEQKEAALAAEHVIVSAEEVVNPSVIRSDPNRTIVPGMVVDAVVHEPYAAHPSYAKGYYDSDNDFYVWWDKVSDDEKSLKAYMDEWVFGVKSRSEYVEKLGEEKLARLRVKPRPSAPVDYGGY